MAMMEQVLERYGLQACALHEAIAYWQEQKPQEVAIIAKDGQLTYSQLKERIDFFVAALSQLGVREQDLVAVSVGRSINLLPLLVAIGALGAAYVPVDPDYPVTRRRYIIDDVGAKLLIHDGIDDTQCGAQVVSFEGLLAQAVDSLGGAMAVPFVAGRPAYVIYTSGSTGNPKGVVVSQGNVSNFLVAMARQPGMDHHDPLLAVTTISFDIHVLELFLPLLCGASVVLATTEEARSQAQLQRIIDDGYITVMQATPATWRLLLGAGWQPVLPLKILVGGEALPRDLVPLMLASASELWNMYGPTETTVWSTCCQVTSANDPIYIGKPIRNTTVFVVDDANQLVAPDVVGELLIGGAGVSLGYKGRLELSVDKFVHLPHLAEGVVYRTGDLVKATPDGFLQYVNRKDNQIKIRGFRVEPGDVEQALLDHPGVEQVAVVASEFAVGDMRLMAFYLGAALEAAHLRKHCGAILPQHMVPQNFVHLAQFPLTENNKLNRRELQNLGKQYFQTNDASPVNGKARDDRDRSLIAIWAKALSHSNIGIDDNFFDLGGHSLLVLSTVEGMNKAAGLHYTAADLFERPTIRQLLSVTDGNQHAAASVVKLNEVAVAGVPVFCLCGVSIYQELAAQFKLQPVFGVFAEQEIALIDAAKNNDTFQVSIPHLVDVYVDAILRQGDFSAVILVGLSFGGILSVEVAKHLSERGVQVKHIVLLDSYLAGCAKRSPVKIILDVLARINQRGFVHALKRAFVRISKRLNNTASNEKHGEPTDLADALRAQMFDQLSAGYQRTASKFNQDVLLIKATNTDFGLGYVAEFDYGWGKVVAGKLTINSVQADHIGMMSGKAIIDVYGHIAQYLQTDVES